MPNKISVTRRHGAIFAALAGFALLIAPVAGVRAQGTPNPTAAAVSVVNPVTYPALTRDVDAAGRVPYLSRDTTDYGLCVLFSKTACFDTVNCSQNICYGDFAAVPSGYRLVILHASGNLTYGGSPNSALVRLTLNPLWADSIFLSPLGGGVTAFDMPVLDYIDGPNTPILQVEFYGGSIPGIGKTGNLMVSGYLINCTVSACPAVVGGPTPQQPIAGARHGQP